MMTKKGAIVLVISALASLQFGKIFVPEGFERPIFFRIKVVSMEILGLIAKGCTILNYGTEPTNFRYLIRAIIEMNKKSDPLVHTIDKKINGVNVRIYTPKEASFKVPMPILIYYHGGGYFMGDLNAYDLWLYSIVKRLNLVAISVDYRMSPEHPFPIPTTDCYVLTKYVFDNALTEFNGDSDRIILAGDSAGGNVVAVLTQKFLKEKRKLPKLQILIYPWMQSVNLRLPSAVKYSSTGLMSKYSIGKVLAWYLGHTNIADELEPILNSNNHTLLLDESSKAKIKSYLSVDLIPAEYKKSSYYSDYDQAFVYPTVKLDGKIKKEKKLAENIRNIFSAEISPGIADPQHLVGLPKAYFIVVEWDALKDESLIYSERLRLAGVDVTVAFYDDTFHGVLTFIEPNLGYSAAHKIHEDLISYIKKNI